MELGLGIKGVIVRLRIIDKDKQGTNIALCTSLLRSSLKSIALSKMAQAILLPPFSDQALVIIRAPNTPSNPPSMIDITNAMHYSWTLLNVVLAQSE